MPKSLKKNAFFNFVKCFMNIIFPIISFPYASRILLPQGIGRVNFANSVIEYFLIIAELGISTYAAREAAKIRDDKEKLNKFAREIFTINIFSTVFSYTLLLFSLIFVDKFSEYRTLLIICSTKVLFTTAGIAWLFTAMEDFGYITMRSIALQVLSLIFLFAFVHDSGDVYQYAAMGVFSNVGANVFNFFYARKYINLFAKTKLELRKHFKPIFVFFGIGCANKINQAIDAVMLGFMLGDIYVGFYSAASKLSKMVIELITSVVSSFMPRSSYYVENNLQKEYQKVIEKVFGVAMFFSFPAAAGLFVLCKPLILIFSGEQYLPAASAMQVLSIGIIGWVTNSFLNNLIITPQRKEKYALASRIAAASFNIAFNYIFIKKLGVFGAALATVIVEFILPSIVLIPSFKYLKSKQNLIAILQAVSGTAVMFAVIYFTGNLIVSNFLKIIFCVAAGSITYALAELILRNKTAFMLWGIVNGIICKKRK